MRINDGNRIFGNVKVVPEFKIIFELTRWTSTKHNCAYEFEEEIKRAVERNTLFPPEDEE